MFQTADACDIIMFDTVNSTSLEISSCGSDTTACVQTYSRCNAPDLTPQPSDGNCTVASTNLTLPVDSGNCTNNTSHMLPAQVYCGNCSNATLPVCGNCTNDTLSVYSGNCTNDTSCMTLPFYGLNCTNGTNCLEANNTTDDTSCEESFDVVTLPFLKQVRIHAIDIDCSDEPCDFQDLQSLTPHDDTWRNVSGETVCV